MCLPPTFGVIARSDFNVQTAYFLLFISLHHKVTRKFKIRLVRFRDYTASHAERGYFIKKRYSHGGKSVRFLLHYVSDFNSNASSASKFVDVIRSAKIFDLAFLVVTPWNVIDGYQLMEEMYCLHLQGDMM